MRALFSFEYVVQGLFLSGGCHYWGGAVLLDWCGGGREGGGGSGIQDPSLHERQSLMEQSRMGSRGKLSGSGWGSRRDRAVCLRLHSEISAWPRVGASGGTSVCAWLTTIALTAGNCSLSRLPPHRKRVPYLLNSPFLSVSFSSGSVPVLPCARNMFN